AVGARLLVEPAAGDLDPAVGALAAVPDHEVIPAPLRAQAIAVVAIDLGIGAGGVVAVMQDDVLPGPIRLRRKEQVVGLLDEARDPVPGGVVAGPRSYGRAPIGLLPGLRRGERRG